MQTLSGLYTIKQTIHKCRNANFIFAVSNLKSITCKRTHNVLEHVQCSFNSIKHIRYYGDFNNSHHACASHGKYESIIRIGEINVSIDTYDKCLE